MHTHTRTHDGNSQGVSQPNSPATPRSKPAVKVKEKTRLQERKDFKKEPEEIDKEKHKQAEQSQHTMPARELGNDAEEREKDTKGRETEAAEGGGYKNTSIGSAEAVIPPEIHDLAVFLVKRCVSLLEVVSSQIAY